MKRLFTLFIAILCLTAVSAQTEKLQDVIYLKNGTVLRGTIVEHRIGEAIRFAVEGGSVVEYSIEDIDRFTKEVSVTKSKTPRLLSYMERMQQSPWRPRGYRGFAELGAAFALNYPDVMYQVSTSHGFQADPNIYMGAGFNLTYDATNEWFFVPLFANLRFSFSKGQFTPFVDVRAGYSPFATKGAYAALSIGAHYSLSSTLGLNLSVGYDMQKFEDQKDIHPEKPSDYMHGIGIKVGIEF